MSTKKSQQKLIIHQWQNNLHTLKQKYESLVPKSKKNTLSNKKVIQELNHTHIKADHILVEEFLQNYSKKQQLQKVSTFLEVKSFFQSLKENYQKVEEEYLKCDQRKNIEGAEEQKIDDKKRRQVYFERNKINLSKYIKDEPQAYRKALESNLQKINENDEDDTETGIHANRINEFFKKLLGNHDDQSNKHLKVYKHKKLLLDENLSEDNQKFQQKMLNLVKNYVVQVKQLPQNTFSLEEIYITEEQILQFLTYWLQTSSKSSQSPICIIYARTEQMLQLLEERYLRQIPEEIQQISKNAREDSVKIVRASSKNEFIHDFKGALGETEKDDITHNLQKNIKPFITQSQELQNQLTKQISSQQNPSQSILNRYRQPTPTLQQSTSSQQLKKSKSLNREEQLQKISPQLFTYACKKRARIHKNTTFDEIQQESKFMNLEKFINFCNYLEINELIGREILIDKFKLHAINRLTLNVEKFLLLLKILIEINPEVMNKLFSAEKLSFLKKKDFSKKVIKHNEGNKSLSQYKHELRPINGKDVESVEIQLQEKKKMKELMKRQKQELILKLKKRQQTQINGGMFSKYQVLLQNKGTKPHKTSSTNRTIHHSINQSNLTFRDPNQNSKKQTFFNLRNQRANSEKFNPESLIMNLGQPDKLWDDYEAKIWKKQKERSIFSFGREEDIQKNEPISNRNNESILEEALSKRIERGNKVLQKINSTKLKYYL